MQNPQANTLPRVEPFHLSLSPDSGVDTDLGVGGSFIGKPLLLSVYPPPGGVPSLAEYMASPTSRPCPNLEVAIYLGGENCSLLSLG